VPHPFPYRTTQSVLPRKPPISTSTSHFPDTFCNPPPTTRSFFPQHFCTPPFLETFLSPWPPFDECSGCLACFSARQLFRLPFQSTSPLSERRLHKKPLQTRASRACPIPRPPPGPPLPRLPDPHPYCSAPHRAHIRRTPLPRFFFSSPAALLFCATNFSRFVAALRSFFLLLSRAWLRQFWSFPFCLNPTKPDCSPKHQPLLDVIRASRSF